MGHHAPLGLEASPRHSASDWQGRIPLSFSIYVQRFWNGERATFPRSYIEETFGLNIVSREPKFGCMVLEYPAEGHAGDVYVGSEEQIDGFSINRPGGDRFPLFWSSILHLMQKAGLVLHWPSTGPSLTVTDLALVEHVPSEMLEAIGPAFLVSSGAEILEAIRRS